MCKISNQKAVQELIFALEPDALASAVGNVSVVNAHVDLFSDHLRHAKGL
jgi:hypothetical protein